jgi:hypothetical protein
MYSLAGHDLLFLKRASKSGQDDASNIDLITWGRLQDDLKSEYNYLRNGELMVHGV